MKATVMKANYERSMYVFEREDGEYGFFEVLDFVDFEPEEVLIGDFNGIGERVVIQKCTNKRVKICIEDFCSLKHAIEMIR